MAMAMASIAASSAAQIACTNSLRDSKASAVRSACPQYAGLRRSNPKFDTLSNPNLFSQMQRSIQSSAGSGNRGVVSMAGTGKFFVGGNWKCNGTKDSIAKLVTDLNNAKLEDDVDIIVAPPFLYIDQVKRSLTGRIEVSAQNSWVGKGGAFTGEISVEQLKDIGCEWVIHGHSERRHIIGEGNEFIGKKAGYALSQNLKVIACIGEKLEEREAGKTFDVCFEQLKAFADNVPSWVNVVIAYEPVWAIGTGKVATPQQAQEVHVAVREWLNKNVSAEVASQTRIIYGGRPLIIVCTVLQFSNSDIDRWNAQFFLPQALVCKKTKLSNLDTDCIESTSNSLKQSTSDEYFVVLQSD